MGDFFNQNARNQLDKYLFGDTGQPNQTSRPPSGSSSSQVRQIPVQIAIPGATIAGWVPDGSNIIGYQQVPATQQLISAQGSLGSLVDGISFPGQNAQSAGILGQQWGSFNQNVSGQAYGIVGVGGGSQMTGSMESDYSNDGAVLLDPHNDPMLGPSHSDPQYQLSSSGSSQDFSGIVAANPVISPLKTPTRETLAAPSPFRTPSLGQLPYPSVDAQSPTAFTNEPSQQLSRQTSRQKVVAQLQLEDQVRQHPLLQPTAPPAQQRAPSSTAAPIRYESQTIDVSRSKVIQSVPAAPKPVVEAQPSITSTSKKTKTKTTTPKPKAGPKAPPPVPRPVGVGQGKPENFLSGIRRLRKMLDLKKQKEIECIVCKKFLKVAGMEAHVYTHSKDPLFLCRLCPYSSTSPGSATSHATSAHKTASTEAIDDRRQLFDQDLAMSLKSLFQAKLGVSTAGPAEAIPKLPNLEKEDSSSSNSAFSQYAAANSGLAISFMGQIEPTQFQPRSAFEPLPLPSNFHVRSQPSPTARLTPQPGPMPVRVPSRPSSRSSPAVPKFDKTLKVKEAISKSAKPLFPDGHVRAETIPDTKSNDFLTTSQPIDVASSSNKNMDFIQDYSLENFPELANLDSAPGISPVKSNRLGSSSRSYNSWQTQSPIQDPKPSSSSSTAPAPNPAQHNPLKLKIKFGKGSNRQQASISSSITPLKVSSDRLGDVAPADPVHASVNQSLMAVAEKFNLQKGHRLMAQQSQAQELLNRSQILVDRYRVRLAEKKSRVDLPRRVRRFYKKRKTIAKDKSRKPFKNTNRRCHLNLRILKALWYPSYQLRRMKHLGLLLEAIEINSSRQKTWTLPCKICGQHVTAMSRTMVHHILRHSDREYMRGESLETKNWDKEQQFLIRILFFCFKI